MNKRKESNYIEFIIIIPLGISFFFWAHLWKGVGISSYISRKSRFIQIDQIVCVGGVWKTRGKPDTRGFKEPSAKKSLLEAKIHKPCV